MSSEDPTLIDRIHKAQPTDQRALSNLIGAVALIGIVLGAAGLLFVGVNDYFADPIDNQVDGLATFEQDGESVDVILQEVDDEAAQVRVLGTADFNGDINDRTLDDPVGGQVLDVSTDGTADVELDSGLDEGDRVTVVIITESGDEGTIAEWEAGDPANN